jgi:hypothetical protein
VRSAERERDEVIIEPRPEEYVSDEAVPTHWDWRNVVERGGTTNYVTSDVNQHIPQYCGSCWIHGTVAALNDRMKILRRAAFPDVMLSRQAVVNCALNESQVAPGCLGGEPWMVFKLMIQHPIPDESCQPYEARNSDCLASNVCRNCNSSLSGDGACFPVPFAGFRVKEYAQVKGVMNIKKEIMKRGPVTCSYVATDEFVYNYSTNVNQNGGVFTDDTEYPLEQVDHDIEVVGWDETEDGVRYWIARNSWGTYWGEAGWFRVKEGTLHFEDDCWWAIPTVAELDEYLNGEYIGSYNEGLTKQSGENRRSYRPKAFHRIGPFDSLVPQRSETQQSI